MLGPVISGHIIQEDKHTVEAHTNCAHEALEYFHSFHKPKWLPQEFVEAKRCDADCLWCVCCCHMNLVVSANEVNLQEDTGISQPG